MPLFVQAVCALQLQDEGMKYNASLYYAENAIAISKLCGAMRSPKLKTIRQNYFCSQGLINSMPHFSTSRAMLRFPQHGSTSKSDTFRVAKIAL